MNTKQMSVWKEIVRQCKGHTYSSINVAGQVRSDAILAVDALVELVTPELVELLEDMACVYGVHDLAEKSDRAYALAARIKEVLDE